MDPFVGSEAIASGALTRGQLRWNYTALYPNVYVANDAARSISTNAHAASLWSGGTGIIAGKAAAALHGVRWIDESTPIELITSHGRQHPGLIVRQERIEDDEVQARGPLRVTTPARTALDLARRLPRDEAVVLMDALAKMTLLELAEVEALVDRYRGARGMRRAHMAVPLMDGGTRSPAETRLRLMFRDAGIPKPRTNIVLVDGHHCVVLGMGWDSYRVGVSFQDPACQPASLVQQIYQEDVVRRLGWVEVRVAPQHWRPNIIHRVRDALRRRGARV
ncbi:hypothetical protein [Mycobacterium sp. URHB0044]|uniref:hypothetical protein n=1 Tax=Mycobacterium sp. URHB0044 TaxID=1380386 RepID=UPI0004904587|nr:hypothetical protein [Mycobacterium sp. URHB0044]